MGTVSDKEEVFKLGLLKLIILNTRKSTYLLVTQKVADWNPESRRLPEATDLKSHSAST